MSFYKELENHVHQQQSRRNFLSKTSMGLGAAAMASLLNSDNSFANQVISGTPEGASMPIGNSSPK